MKDVPDSFLLNMAEVSGGMLGLFVVGLFFYAESGIGRLGGADGRALDAYLRASTRIVLILFVVPLLLSMTLVTLEPGWSAALFALLSVALVAANVDTVRRIRRLDRRAGSSVLFINEVAGSIAVAVLVLLPWLLGGMTPTREDLTWAVLLSFAAALASVFALVLSIFDLKDGS